MDKDKLDDNDIVLESGFAYKAKKLKYTRKGKIKVNFYTNREKDITESKYKRNLPKSIQENKTYKRVEKHTETTLRIVEEQKD